MLLPFEQHPTDTCCLCTAGSRGSRTCLCRSHEPVWPSVLRCEDWPAAGSMEKNTVALLSMQKETKLVKFTHKVHFHFLIYLCVPENRFHIYIYLFSDFVFLTHFLKKIAFFHLFLHWSNSRRLLPNTSPRRSTRCCLNSNLSSCNSGGCWSATAKMKQSKVELRQQVAPSVVTRSGPDTRTWLMCSTHLEQLAFQRLSGCRTSVSFPTYCT